MSANEWDDYAADWDGNEDVQSYARKAFASWEKKVVPLYPSMSQLKVLDFGCGTGLLTEKLAARCGQVVAVDTSPKMIGVLRNKLALSGASNVTSLSLAINAKSIGENPELLRNFDLIVASSVCSFLADYESTLCELSTMMKPGAYFVQWDWMEDMPVETVRHAFAASGLVVYGIDQPFSMDGDGKSMPVIMGIGQKPS